MKTTTTPPSPAIILDVARDNWSRWNQAFKLLCYTTFGVAGQQVLFDSLIPLYPFATEPTQADDRKVYATSFRRFSDQDTAYLDHLYKHILPASHTAVKTHSAYPAYRLVPIGIRSYAVYTMVRVIHSIGNAATKLHRTRLYVNISQSDLPNEAYMDLVISMTATFKLDFESTAHPGFIFISELTSFL